MENFIRSDRIVIENFSTDLEIFFHQRVTKIFIAIKNVIQIDQDFLMKISRDFDALGGAEGHQTRSRRRAEGSSTLCFEELLRVLLILLVRRFPAEIFSSSRA